MSDEPEHKSLTEIIEDQIGRCLPDRLRNDEKFIQGLGRTLWLPLAGSWAGRLWNAFWKRR